MVCSPKQEQGLGLKGLRLLNRAYFPEEDLEDCLRELQSLGSVDVT